MLVSWCFLKRRAFPKNVYQKQSWYKFLCTKGGVQNVLFALYIFYLYISNRNVHTHTQYIYICNIVPDVPIIYNVYTYIIIYIYIIPHKCKMFGTHFGTSATSLGARAHARGLDASNNAGHLNSSMWN